MQLSKYYITPAGNIHKRESLNIFAKFAACIFGIIWLIPVFFAALIIGSYMAIKNIYH